MALPCFTENIMDEIQRHPAENTMAIHPDIDDGGPAPRDGAPETIPLGLNEPDRPHLRRFVDDDPHGLKNRGEGELSKKTHFPNPSIEHQEYPKAVYKGDKTHVVNSEDDFNQAVSQGWSEKDYLDVLNDRINAF
jgi:hypothetical protein